MKKGVKKEILKKSKEISKNKKAQLGMLILVAIVAVVIFVGIFYITSDNRLDKEYFSSTEIKPKINDIQGSIINCMDETCKDALETIGIQGGYYKRTGEFYDLKWAFIPYYYNQGQIVMPSKKQIESELGGYVNDNLNTCLNDLKFGDFKLDYKNPKTTASISEKEVEFDIDMPVSVERENKKMILELKDLPIFRKSALYDILDVAEYYTEGHRQDSNLFCISCVDKMVTEKDLYFDLIDFKEDSVIVIISENYTSSEPYSFLFLNKYVGNEKSTEISGTLGAPQAPSAEGE